MNIHQNSPARIPTFGQLLDRKNREAETEYLRNRAARNSVSTILLPLDQLPTIPEALQYVEPSISVWAGNEVWITATLYYKTLSIPAMLPILEYLERVYSCEFKSQDDASGCRTFILEVRDLNLDIYLRVYPSETSDSSCRKILVGEDVRTETIRTPRYAIDCSEIAK